MPIGGRGARDARLGLLGSPLSPGFSECVLGFAWLGRGGGLQKEKRPLLDRARDLIIHGSAHRGANGVAMPTDEDDQDGHFFYSHSERGAYSAA